MHLMHYNFDFSLANSVTIFFFDFGKGKSQAKKITLIVGPWVSKDQGTSLAGSAGQLTHFLYLTL